MLMKTGGRLTVALGLALALALGLALAVGAEAGKPSQCSDPQRCADRLRHGQEAFDRGQFNQAKAFFREAVQADPASVKAWSFYDLSMMYAVAEQIKKTGTVRDSSAPAPDAYQPTPAPAPSPVPLAPSVVPPTPPGGSPAIPVIKPDEGC
jgi:hypothetical protein